MTKYIVAIAIGMTVAWFSRSYHGLVGFFGGLVVTEALILVWYFLAKHHNRRE